MDKPEQDMVPNVELPLATPFTVQFTAMFANPVAGVIGTSVAWRQRFPSNRCRADLCFFAHVSRKGQRQADSVELQRFNAASGRLAGAVIPFRQEYSATSTELAHLEQVYQRERNTQQNLLQEGQRLE
jgi:hypothetical protein